MTRMISQVGRNFYPLYKGCFTPHPTSRFAAGHLPPTGEGRYIDKLMGTKLGPAAAGVRHLTVVRE